jgi:glycerophosphoryl diester phosphodiesterase
VKKLNTLAAVAAVMVIVGVTQTTTALPWYVQPWYWPRTADHRPLILAHQGGEGEYPSNSMLAFTKAHEAGADALDTDLQITEDGVLVLFHDDTLDARTNGTGPVSSQTYAQLRTLDFAYNWSPDGGATFPYRGKGITVATAAELFTAFPHDRLSIEIKPESAPVARQFCGLVKQFHAENRVLVSSFAQTQMDAFRAACPGVATSATQAEVLQFYQLEQASKLQGYCPPYSSLQVPPEENGIEILTPGFVAAAHSLHLKVFAWTINTPEQAQPLIDLGIDGIITSYPKRLADWIDGGG